LPERIGPIKKPLYNALSPPPLIKGDERGLLMFDVNIILKKIKEKNPWNYLTKKACPPFEGQAHCAFYRITLLLPITVVGEPFFNINLIKILEGSEHLFIFLINFFEGISDYLHPFGCHPPEGRTAWSGWQPKTFHHRLDRKWISDFIRDFKPFIRF
jgi:hypothetical protein